MIYNLVVSKNRNEFISLINTDNTITIIDIKFFRIFKNFDINEIENFQFFKEIHKKNFKEALKQKREFKSQNQKIDFSKENIRKVVISNNE